MYGRQNQKLNNKNSIGLGVSELPKKRNVTLCPFPVTFCADLNGIER